MLVIRITTDGTILHNFLNRRTPLSVASYRGSTNIVKFLLENTSQSQNEATVFGLTALMCAVYTGRYKTCQYLVGSGVSINSAGAGIFDISI
jgi:ankyrin repeat protein